MATKLTNYSDADVVDAVLKSQEILAVTQAQKLALTGKLTGQLVRLTDRGNRIEMYNGGTISADSGWDVIVNTYELQGYFESTNGTLNGVSCTADTMTSCGWVKAGRYVGVGNGDGTTGVIVTVNDITMITPITDLEINTMALFVLGDVLQSGQGFFYAPDGMPDRGKLQLIFPSGG